MTLKPTQRPAILQVIPQLDGGGAERTVVEMSAAITRAGWRALVLAENGRLSDAVRAAGGEITTFPAGTKSPLRLWRNATAMAMFIRANDVRLVHARSRAPAWSALKAARATGVPFVTTYHGAYGETGPIKRLYNSVMARGDLIIANSQFTADLVQQRYGTPTAKIVVVNRGVDLALFDPAIVGVVRPSNLRAQWGVPTSAKIVLLAARLTDWKGQRVLIEALGLLKSRGLLGDAVAILAGDAQGRDGYVQTLQADVRRYGVGDHVKLVGHVSDVAAAFAAAWVTVIASTKPEAFGRSAAEAEALGCPVIATRLGAPQETVLALPTVGIDQRTGWLVAPSNAAAMADALVEALTLNEAARRSMGDRARAYVAANYALTGLQRQTLGVYDRLLGTSLEAAFLNYAAA